MQSQQSPVGVEEFHGPYGPYQVSELVLQRIWLKQAFSAGQLFDQWGRRVEVLQPGEWNRLEGPDFRNALLRIDGEEKRGDIEVHFSQADWKAHGHESDPAFENVALHVLYHEVAYEGAGARTRNGEELPRVSLLPLLWYSLEEYAGDDSLIASTQVDLRPEVESLLEASVEARRERLVEWARLRWEMKVFYAGKRIEKRGWKGACHQAALEVMGYARNRVPMLMIAEQVGLGVFGATYTDTDHLWEIGRDRWRLSGCRPANHPRLRLQQYSELCRLHPDWPSKAAYRLSRALEQASEVRSVKWGRAEMRKLLGVQAARRCLVKGVLHDQFGSQKCDTLICDALLPLFQAERGVDLFALWFHWNAGTGPEDCLAGLKTLQILEPRVLPMGNGWLQGMLGARTQANVEALR